MVLQRDGTFHPELHRVFRHSWVSSGLGFHKYGRPVYVDSRYSAAVWLGGLVADVDMYGTELPVIACAVPKIQNNHVNADDSVWHVGAITPVAVGLHIVRQEEVTYEYDSQAAFDSCFIGPVNKKDAVVGLNSMVKNTSNVVLP